VTNSWILEKDTERFLSATETIHWPDPQLLRKFGCPFCSMVFFTRNESQRHISTDHQIKRPWLQIKDMEPAQRETIRTKLNKSDINITNTTSLKFALNGEAFNELSSEEVIEKIANTWSGEISLSLVNDGLQNAVPICSNYEISLRVASSDDLRLVDQVFLDVIAGNNISRHVVDQFLNDTRLNEAGLEYAEGLACYVLGVLLKERPDYEELTTPYASYREKFGSSLQKLSDYQTPLSALVISIIKFALNDFSDTNNASGYLCLDRTISLLRDPKNFEVIQMQTEPDTLMPICPVDHGTGQILALSERMSNLDRWGPVLDEEFRRAAGSDILGASDRQKAYAIWASTAWRLGVKENAVEPLRQISSVHPFGCWAKPYLESIAK
jgi:hypothetical protein